MRFFPVFRGKTDENKYESLFVYFAAFDVGDCDKRPGFLGAVVRFLTFWWFCLLTGSVLLGDLALFVCYQAES